MKPFAAASIGQVHSATLSWDSPLVADEFRDGEFDERRRRGEPLEVAVKVQFPGVRESISSDLSNLKWLLLATAVLPRGLYLDNTLKVLERELIQECDYEREARFGVAMRRLIFDDLSKLRRDFDVPRVVTALSGKMVLTTEMMYGKPLKSVMSVDQDKRDWVRSFLSFSSPSTLQKPALLRCSTAPRARLRCVRVHVRLTLRSPCRRLELGFSICASTSCSSSGSCKPIQTGATSSTTNGHER